MWPREPWLPSKGAGVVVVLRAGGDAEAVAQRLESVCGTVLVEPVEPADVAQLCWLVPRSQAGASVGRGVEGRRGTPLAKQTKSRISKWSTLDSQPAVFL